MSARLSRMHLYIIEGKTQAFFSKRLDLDIGFFRCCIDDIDNAFIASVGDMYIFYCKGKIDWFNYEFEHPFIDTYQSNRLNCSLKAVMCNI